MQCVLTTGPQEKRGGPWTNWRRLENYLKVLLQSAKSTIKLENVSPLTKCSKISAGNVRSVSTFLENLQSMELNCTLWLIVKPITRVTLKFTVEHNPRVLTLLTIVLRQL
uniref:Uncharacterized protein n=1 Tax=Cacopsylla melanoneura TaxID=428564 RepID=A0A8D8YJR4_9HEMI